MISVESIFSSIVLSENMLYHASILALVASLASSTRFVNQEAAERFQWEQFKKDYNKVYAGDEDTSRFGYFKENLRNAAIREEEDAKAGGTSEHGVTQFSDLSQKEFESLLTADVNKRTTRGVLVDKVPAPVNAVGLVDWTGILTTDVKDQGYCGSCWAFSAAEQIESDSMRTLNTTYILSAQQINQCTTACGCQGGATEAAYTYVSNSGGLELESDIPYTPSTYEGVTGQCIEDATKGVIGVSRFYEVLGETNMANYVLGTGPLSVCVDATTWNTYKGGIMSVCGNRVNHCVQAVGVDISSAWKVRNSWGVRFGEYGFIRLKYGKDTCAISTDPTYVDVFAV